MSSPGKPCLSINKLADVGHGRARGAFRAGMGVDEPALSGANPAQVDTKFSPVAPGGRLGAAGGIDEAAHVGKLLVAKLVLVAL